MSPYWGTKTSAFGFSVRNVSAAQFVFVGVAGEGIEGGNPRANFVRFAENVDYTNTLHREIPVAAYVASAKDSIRFLCRQAKEVVFYGLTPPTVAVQFVNFRD